ncbi:MAG: serine/threonine protein phosphatase, partial [Clostridia bacterium]
VLKGNHDYWWETASKTKRILSENGIEGIDIIHNNAFLHESTAICGTRGWFYEEDAEGSHGKKIYNRELGRLKTSLDAARALQASRIICFLHYPPICDGYECEEITEMLSEAGVDECCYGHLHGYGHVHGFNGVHEGVLYKLISADYLKFTPIAL